MSTAEVTCADCDGALDHCHGTLVVHGTNVVECTDEQCIQLHAVRHTFVVDCSAFAGGCTCADIVEWVARAS